MSGFEALRGASASEFERAIGAGGVVLFPSDTVYGLACDPANRDAIDRLYALKRRHAEKPSALMYFDRDRALAALPQQGQRTHHVLLRLLPGPVTVLLAGGVGVRVVDVPELRGATCAVLQSSANLSGGADSRRLSDVPQEIRSAVELEIDGGELPGVSSTVVDLSDYERGGGWVLVRRGALPEQQLAAILDAG
jgi:L-threonylcarbamoyladenylate synthase